MTLPLLQQIVSLIDIISCQFEVKASWEPAYINQIETTQMDDSLDSIIAYSDEGSISDREPELSEEEEEQQGPTEPDRLNKTEGVPPELMFVIFGHYKKECEELAAEHKCQIKWSISAYIVEQVGEGTKEQFGQCLQRLSELVYSIKIEDVSTLFLKPNEQFRYYRSPYIKEMIGAKKINFMMFKMKLYGFSKEVPRETIRQEVLGIIKKVQVFSICVTKMRRGIKGGNSWVPRIYESVQAYMESMVEHLSSFFKDRELIAMFDQDKKYMLVHGGRGKYLMEAKSTIKNILESLVCIMIKDTKVKDGTLVKYLKKASLYPVHFSRINNHTTILITKDNILKQLASKSPQFMKLVGLERSEEELQSSNDPLIGFYMIASPSFETRLDKIREKIKSRNYDIYTSMGVKFLRQNFVQQGKKQENVYKQLLVEIALGVDEGKIRFEAARPIQKQEQRPLQVDDGLEYQIIAGKTQEEKMSKTLRRDVLSEKVHMKKKYLIAYNVVETKEFPTLWEVDKKGKPGSEVSIEQLKNGTYLRGAKKQGDRDEWVYNFEELLTVL